MKTVVGHLLKHKAVAVFAKFIWSLVPLATLILVGELFFRISVPDVLVRRWEAAMYFDMMEDSEHFGRVMKKSYDGRILADGVDFDVSTNSKGLRDREFAYDKDHDAIRILVLGDSITFGYGVEQDEAWPKRLEEHLRERLNNKRVEVINAAFTGWGTFNEKEFLLREGLRYNPDIVLLGFYWSDLVDNLEGKVVKQGIDSWGVQQKNLAKYLKDKPFAKSMNWLLNNSYLYVYLENHFEKIWKESESVYFKYSNRERVGAISRPDYRTGGLPSEGISLIDLTKKVESDLRIDKWRVISTTDSEVRLLVWRPYPEGAGFGLVWQSDTKKLGNKGEYSFGISPAFDVLPGDRLGLFLKGGEIPRNYPYEGEKLYEIGENDFVFSNGHRDAFSGYSFQVTGKRIRNAEKKRTQNKEIISSSAKPEKRSSDIGQEPEYLSNNLAQFLNYGRLKEEQTNRSWESTMKLFGEMKEASDEKGAKFYVVYLPHFEEVGKGRDGWNMQPSPEQLEKKLAIDLAFPRAKMNHELSKAGIDFIDITEGVRSSVEKVLYAKDSHYNAFGHDVVAKEISTVLTERKAVGRN